MASSPAPSAAVPGPPVVDIAMLDRVLLRLAGTPEDALGGVLHVLLPQLLGLLTADAPPAVRAKLLELLSDISSRVRERPSVPLPFDALLAALPTAPPFSTPFVLLYLRLAFARLTPAQLDAACPRLLAAGAGVDAAAAAPPPLRDAILLMGLRALRGVAVPATDAERAAKFGVLRTAAGTAAVAALLLDAVLYHRPASGGAAAAAAAAAASPATLSNVVPAGLSVAATCRLLGVAPPPPAAAAGAAAGSDGAATAAALLAAAAALPPDEATQRKRDVLRVLGAGLLPPTAALPVAVAAAADAAHDVVVAAEDYLRQFGPSADLSAPALVDALTALVAGAPAAGRAPAPPAIRARALSYLSRSAAVLAAPGGAALRLVFAAAVGGGTTLKLQLLGVKLATLVFAAVAPPPPLQPLPPLAAAAAAAATATAAADAPAVVVVDAGAAAAAALAPLAPLYLQGLLKLLAGDAAVAAGGGGTEAAPPPPHAPPATVAAAAAASVSAAAVRVDAARESDITHSDADARERLRDGVNAAVGELAARATAAFPTRAARADAARESVIAYRDADDKERLREAVYAAVGALAARAPAAFRTSLAVARLLFGRLEAEAPGARLAVSEALSLLATAYERRSGGGAAAAPPLAPPLLEELHGLLLASARSPEYRVRLAALDWAARVYPFSDVRVRYVCISLTADPRPEVREAARAGLRPWARASSSLGGGRKFRGAHGDADRGELAGIARRGGALRTAVTVGGGAGVAPQAGDDGAGGGDDVEPWGDADDLNSAVLADEGAFGAVAGRYPLFQSLVRFLTALDEDEEGEVEVAVAVSGAVAGGVAAGAADGSGGGKRQRTGGGSGGVVTWAVPEAAAAAAAPPSGDAAAAGLSYVDQPDGSRVPLGRTVTSLPPLALAAALEFANTTLDATAAMARSSTAAYVARLDAGGAGGGGLTVLHAYRSLVELGLATDPALPDAARAHETAAACLARLLEAAPARLCAIYAGRLGWLLRWLRDTNGDIRRSVAVVLGTAVSALPLDDDEVDADAAAAPPPTAATVVTDLLAIVSSGADGAAARTADARHGALLALGHALGARRRRQEPTSDGADVDMAGAGAASASSTLTATALRRPRFDDALVARATAAIVTALGDRSDAMRSSATAALTLVARGGALPLREGDAVEAPPPDAAAPVTTAAAAAAAVRTRTQLVALLFNLATGRIGRTAAETAALSAAAGAANAAAAAAAEDADAAARGEGRHTGVTEAAAVCLGAIAAGEMRGSAAAAAGGVDGTVPPVASAALDALLRLSANRFEAVAFTVGAALVEAADGRAAALPSGGARASVGTLLADTAAALDAYSAVGAVDDGGDGIASPSTTGSDIAAPLQRLRDAATGRVLDAILAGALQSLSAIERTSAAVWLLSLTAALSRTGRGRGSGRRSGAGGSAALTARLPLLQTAFTRLLSEKSQFTQEAAAKGLALVYDATDGGQRASLVASLVAALDTGRRVPAAAALPPVALTSATATAAAGAAGPPQLEAGPASLALSAGGAGAYRELCAVANEAGQPELIYRFLALSSHHALWHTRGGAGFGLEALLSSSARAAVAPHLDRLVPKLFRYLYDPSERVRESMARLWGALVRDPQAAVTRHCGRIIDELIVASVGDNWREREAAVSALGDVLLGRSGADITPRLEPLWRAVLRSVDDIKESVKEAGVATLKVLGRLTVRLCDPATAGATAGAAAVSVGLPFLLRDGVTSPLKAAQAACLSVLGDVVAVAGPLLRPHLGELVHTALASMANLERSELSHLQLHADAGTGQYGAGLSSERLEQVRIGAARSGPLGDILDRCAAQLRETGLVRLLGAAGAAAALADDLPPTSSSAAPPRRRNDDADDDVALATLATAALGGGGGSGGGAVPTDEDGPRRRGVEADDGVLPPLVDRLRALIRHGIGLPTRGATARFVAALPSSLPDAAVRAAVAGPLLRALGASLDDPSPTLRREFGAAAAAMCRQARPAAVRRYTARLAALARNGDDAGLRTSAGLACAALARAAVERLRDDGALGDLIPLAYLACADPDARVREAWDGAWDALTGSSTASALRLYAGEVVAAIVDGLAASGWTHRRQAAVAAVRMVAALGGAGVASPFAAAGDGGGAGGGGGSAASEGVYAGVWLPLPVLSDMEMAGVGAAAVADGDGAAAAAARSITAHASRLTPPRCSELAPHARDLVAALLAAIPGRVWEGKEALLSALGAVASACPTALGAAPAAVAVVDAGGHAEGTTRGVPPGDSDDDGGAGIGDAGSAAVVVESVVVPLQQQQRPAAAAAVDVAAVVCCLASQASRAGAPLPYVTAALRALASVASALPTTDCFAVIADVVGVALRRSGRPGASAILDAAPVATAAPNASGAASTSGPRLLGGKSGERHENDARNAAKEAELAAADAAVAAFAALAAAWPTVVTRRGDAAAEEGGTTADDAHLLDAVAVAYGVDAGALTHELAVNATVAATQSANGARVCATLRAGLAGAGTVAERIAVLRAAATVAAKSLPLGGAAGGGGREHSGSDGSGNGGVLDDLAAAAAAAADAEDKFAAGRAAALQVALVCVQVAAAALRTRGSSQFTVATRERLTAVAARLRGSPDPKVAAAAARLAVALGRA